MFFALTDDQQAFATTVREFLADRFDLDAVRGVVEDPHGDGHPISLWKGLADQGALAVLVPEEHDGLGLGLLDAQVVARELGRGVAPGPWTATVLAAEALRLAGSPEQQAAWLPGLAAGETIGTVALRGEAGSWDGRGITVDASGERLSGTASPVDYPAVAGVIVVAATDPSGTPGPVPRRERGLRARDPRPGDLRRHRPRRRGGARRHPRRAPERRHALRRRRGGRADGPRRGAHGGGPRRRRPRGAHPHRRLRPRAQAVRRPRRVVPGDQAHDGRPARRRDDGRARRALRRPRRRQPDRGPPTTPGSTSRSPSRRRRPPTPRGPPPAR